ncbi:MAG TPA: sensor histidine kinase, partial [Chryseolinea sp.]|nr:sensor histidine kinase [Chryseolinea sp.]
RKLIAIHICFWLPFFAGSQQTNGLDSLLKLLAHAQEDTNKVSLLLSIEKEYFSANDFDSALYYNNECERLISKVGAHQYEHRCFHEFVKIYHAQAVYGPALDYCLRSIAVAKQQKNRFQEALSYRALFNIYHNLRMNDSAVKYGVYSLRLTEEIKDTVNIATNYANLSWLYLDLNQNDKAIEYGKLGIAAGEKYKDTSGLLTALNNTALCYHRGGNHEKAIGLFSKQLEIANKVNRKRSIVRALINLATSYYALGDKAELGKTTAALNTYFENNPKTDIKLKCFQYIINGYDNILNNNFQEAESHLLEGMQIAEKDSIVDPLLIMYTTLSTIKSAQHDFVSVNFYDQKSDALSQSLQQQELSEYAIELETKYETEKKDNQLKLQEVKIKQKNTLNYILLGSAGALLVISLLAYRNYEHKRKLQQQRISELETEKQLTATEAVLKGEEQERTRLAKDLHDGLGGMLSGIKHSFQNMKGNLVMTPDNHQAFERSMDMLDSSIKEMRRVAHNMMPEALVKFGLDTALKDFCNDINQSGALRVTYQSIGMENTAIEQTMAITIYRIVQELINNSIKHAAAETAIVQISKTNGDISITVEDDGKGFDTTLLKGTKGMGWGNIESRVEYLKGKVDVQSEPGKGTSVLIEIKDAE